MTFRVGMKVVCVDASRTNSWDEEEIAEGQVYTIADIVGDITPFASPIGLREHCQGVGVHLSEIRRPAPFAASRFRPVVERETDISLFTAMLNPKREQVSA